ncbi:MAG: CHASE2 domain-containing protein [Spirochaetales bacterium]
MNEEKASASRLRKILETKNFGLILGFLVFVFFTWLAFFSGFSIFEPMDRSTTDGFFRLRDIVSPQFEQEGATVKPKNDKISPDIMILGIDNRSIETLGRWPFSRSVHADLLNSLSRITDQNQREDSVFLDFFFLDRESQAENDVAFADAIKSHGRVVMETIYAPSTMDVDQSQIQFDRLEVLRQRGGAVKNVTGDWANMPSFETVYAPLIPLAEGAASYGHASFVADADKIFRRQTLVAKITKVLESIELKDLKPDTTDYTNQFVRYAYTDKTGNKVNLPVPLTQQVLDSLPAFLEPIALKRQVTDEGSDQIREVFFIQKVQDIFLPSVTLSMALHYWHKTPADISVSLGDAIVIPAPEAYSVESGSWSRLPQAEVRIPIDQAGNMIVNFMGPRSSEKGDEYQTFPVRSYSSYATRAPSTDVTTWPETRVLGNKVLMVGPFSSGVADDEKTTPYGLMYGVEIHANALNTILTQNFLLDLPVGYVILAMFVLIMLVAFLASRTPTILSLAVTLVLFLVSFVGAALLFDLTSFVFPFTPLAAGIIFTFLLIIVYRALTEERDKQRIRGIFGKYVSPDVVSQLMEHPPELGGVDKELTVLFSDIRGFTSLSEGMSPQELVNHLNLYLTAMTDTIHEYRGTLDKYVGDEIMCFWGAPLEEKDHAELAAKCGLRMMEKLAEMNAEWPENRKINIGIGLNSGIMTVGNMGSQGRMNYTLMGDNVNLGARLEGTNKEYGTNVIISENTYSHFKERAVVRELDNIRVKGKNKPVLIYELVDFVDGFAAPQVVSKK